MSDTKSQPSASRIGGAFRALLGFFLHLIIALPLAFAAFAVLGMLHKAPNQGAHFVYTVAGVSFVVSLIASCLGYRLRRPKMADADSAAFFLFARGLGQAWSGK